MPTLNRVEAPPAAQARGGACPRSFKLLCLQASLAGDTGYDAAGYQLVQDLAGTSAWAVDRDRCEKELARLAEMLFGMDGRRSSAAVAPDERVWRWFEWHYPRCTVLVPPGCRKEFLAGVYRAAADGSTGLRG